MEAACKIYKLGDKSAWSGGKNVWVNAGKIDETECQNVTSATKGAISNSVRTVKSILELELHEDIDKNNFRGK